MTAEENETPGGDSAPGSQPGGGSEGRGRRSEGDLLAERRARRAAESGEHALTLRAEAAEATVRTLETHVSSLQQRLSDAEQQVRRASELIEAERAVRSGGREPQAMRYPPSGAGHEEVLERELRQVKQREYAEQRLRGEAEEQLIDLERESRAEVDRLSRRLGDGEAEARRLAAELESAQRQLAEAEQAAGAGRSAARRDEQALLARVTDLERRALEIQGSLEAERSARERTERLLENMHRGHRVVEALVVELRDAVARLKAAAAAAPSPGRPPAQEPPPPPPAEARAPFSPTPPLAPAPRSLHAGTAHPENGEMVDALAAAVERLRARVAEHAELTAAPVARPPKHKHSQSLITRLRIARKQRRAR